MMKFHYSRNKKSFHQLLQILSSTSEEHHCLVCNALHYSPTKENQLSRQISNLNDAIRLIRHHTISPRKDVAYILIGEKSFDNSQGSLIDPNEHIFNYNLNHAYLITRAIFLHLNIDMTVLEIVACCVPIHRLVKILLKIAANWEARIIYRIV